MLDASQWSGERWGKLSRGWIFDDLQQEARAVLTQLPADWFDAVLNEGSEPFGAEVRRTTP